MNIITGYRGEPHITSAQDRAGNQGSYGTGSYVLNVGNKLAATIASANEIRIADGALCHQGCLANIDAGTYDSVAINNGTQGMNRIDRIVARYTKNAETNVESLDLVVIEGTAVSGTPSAPAYNTGNIQNGDSPVDMPLYQVRLTGVTVASVTKEFDYVRTQKELDAAVSSLNSKKIVQSQLALPSSVVINAGSKATLLSSVNPRDLTKTALDNVPSTGTLKSAVMTWSSGGDCIATDTIVQNGTISLQARNPTSNAMTISAVRLLLLYE